MSFYMGMENVPAGKSMYTVYITFDAESTPRSALCTEEIDIILPTNDEHFYVPNHPDFQREAEATYGENWTESSIVGVVNQSAGFVVFQAQWTEDGCQEVRDVSRR